MSLNKFRATLMGCVSLVALSGCESTNTAITESVLQQAAAPGVSAKDKMVYVYKRDRVKEQVDNIPVWFKKPPEDNDNIFSAGTSVTPDMQFSRDAAVLNAKVILADRIDSRLRSHMKQFRAKIGDGDINSSITTEMEKAVKNVTADTDVSGYHLAEVEVLPHGTQYRAYVLLEYSDVEARKILTNRMRKNRMLMDKLRATKAWKELDETADNKNKDEDARLKSMMGVM